MAAVATKDQERQAVEKIRKIVEGLGTNSYVGTAMQGVLEVAEQNIEYDAAFSLKEEKDIAERREQEQRENAERLNKELEAAKSELAQCKEWWKDQQKILKDELQKALAQADRYRMPKDMYERMGVESVTVKREIGDTANNCFYWKPKDYGTRVFRTFEEAIPLAEEQTKYYEEHYKYGNEPMYRHWI